MTSQTRRRALIIIPSARELLLAEPASVPSLSIGFFVVELAQVLQEFENDYEFKCTTPGGNAPQLNIKRHGPRLPRDRLSTWPAASYEAPKQGQIRRFSSQLRGASLYARTHDRTKGARA